MLSQEEIQKGRKIESAMEFGDLAYRGIVINPQIDHPLVYGYIAKPHNEYSSGELVYAVIGT